MIFYHTATGSLNSVFENNAFASGQKQTFTYGAFGDTQRSAGVFSPGFNGERRDPLTGTTHLGNGYRAYNPALMRFNAPDSSSPFGAGGINCYAYCEGDPVNNIDPSGHSSQKAAIGISLGIFSIVLGIVSGGMALAAGGVFKAVLSFLGPTITGVSAIIAGKNAQEEDQAAQIEALYGPTGPEQDYGQKAMMLGIAGVVAGFMSIGISAFRLSKARKSRLPAKSKASSSGAKKRGRKNVSAQQDDNFTLGVKYEGKGHNPLFDQGSSRQRERRHSSPAALEQVTGVGDIDVHRAGSDSISGTSRQSLSSSGSHGKREVFPEGKITPPSPSPSLESSSTTSLVGIPNSSNTELPIGPFNKYSQSNQPNLHIS